MMKLTLIARQFSCLFTLAVFATAAQAQKEPEKQRVRTVSIPISIFTKEEIKQGQVEEFLQVDRLSVLENGEDQTILSIRSRADAPLALAVLIQDDISSDFNVQLRDLSRFILGLPRGSRVMVAYLRGGTLQTRQRFTDDLTRASKALRPVFSAAGATANSPYEAVLDALERFDALPAGRRAILLISDGLDRSNGASNSSPGQSGDLQVAVLRAQRRSVAVFSIFASAAISTTGLPVLNGQSSLEHLADQTGGRAFFQGTHTPINFTPIFRELNVLIGRQFLLSYLTTNMKKGYYKVQVKSTNPEVKIEHPKGYYYHYR